MQFDKIAILLSELNLWVCKDNFRFTPKNRIPRKFSETIFFFEESKIVSKQWTRSLAPNSQTPCTSRRGVVAVEKLHSGFV